MGVVLEFELDGAKVSRELGVVADGMKDFRKPLDDIGSDLLKTFDMNFASRGALYNSWPARKQMYPWPILERTGRLRSGFFKTVDRNSITLTNDVDYFKYHQSSKPRTALPRRVMIMLRRQDATMIQKTFQAYIVETLRKRGLR